MTPDRQNAGGPQVVLLTALAYAALGWIALKLASPPGFASPVYPAAGVALAAALTYGRRGVLGTVLGAWVTNLLLGVELGHFGGATALNALVIGMGAGLQAGVGAWLVKRQVPQPLTLTEPSELLRFFLLAAPLACLLSATVGCGALVASGLLSWELVAASWWTWWLGDTLGVLIAAPIVLTLIGQPAPAWRARRLTVALPLGLGSMLLVGATLWIDHAHDARLRSTFERDAWSLADQFEARLQGPQHALLALHGLFDTQQHIDPTEMRAAAAAWLERPLFLIAMGYSARVARTDLPAFEASVRAEGPLPDYQVFDRGDQAPAPADPDVVAIRYIEPLQSNRAALGVNALSIPAAREAIQRAAQSGEIAATAGFRLTQAQGDETGTVLYQALYGKNTRPPDAVHEAPAFIGVVFVTLRLDALLNNAAEAIPAYLNWCLRDLDPTASRPRAGGPVGCESAPPRALQYRRGLALGGRQFELRVEADHAIAPGLADGGGWLFSVVGMLSTSLLGAFLLTISGRQRRIEAAELERTVDLERTSAALGESEERLRNIVAHVPIGVVYADGEGRVREANPGLLRLLGWTGGLPPGQDLLAWTHPDDRATTAELLNTLINGGNTPLRAQVRLLGAKGQVITVKLGLTALRDEDGSPRRLVGVVEDVSEHLKLEASERALERAEAASRAKSEFVGRMSHELRTPLNAMLGFSQLLDRDSAAPLAPHQRRWSAQIQDAGWHLLNLINDTLDLSMVESGAVRLSLQPLDPEALLLATVPLLSAAAERRQVRILPPEVASDTGRLLGDETRVRQILTNLLSNAVKYNVAGGQVDVQALRAGDQVELVVHDTGIGLSEQQVQDLFQPFNRLGREVSGIEGAGIGLVLSRRLAEMMDGQLTLRRDGRPGTTFVLSLPAVDEAAAASPGAATAAAAPRYPERRVHYIEDNETNSLLMRGLLAQRPQIELTVSALGLPGLAAVRERRPDLLLLDMHLPDIDGLELLRRLKDDDLTAAIPVLVLSADATRSRIEAALAAGAAGYLPKPLDMTALLAAVDEVLTMGDSRWG